MVNFNILLNTINIIGFNLYNLSTQTVTVTDLAKFLGWSTLQPPHFWQCDMKEVEVVVLLLGEIKSYLFLRFLLIT